VESVKCKAKKGDQRKPIPIKATAGSMNQQGTL